MSLGFTNKHLEKKNVILADEFGFAYNGKARVRWFDTAHPEMRYFIEHEKESKIVSPDTGLYGVTSVWGRHPCVEIYGKGFILGIFKDPLSEAEHMALYGDKAPWQAEGNYVPVENTKREPHEVPDKRVTNYVKDCLKTMIDAGADLAGNYAGGRVVQVCPSCGDEVQSLGVTCDYCGQVIEEVKFKGDAILESLARQHKYVADALYKEIEDEIEDSFKELMHVPGARGGDRSFGGSDFSKAN